MAPSEERTIREEVADFRVEFRVFVTKMMGDDEEESTEGRIPRLESMSRSLDRRVKRLEGLVLMAFGAVGIIKLLAWVMNTGSHLLEIAKNYR